MLFLEPLLINSASTTHIGIGEARAYMELGGRVDNDNLLKVSCKNQKAFFRIKLIAGDLSEELRTIGIVHPNISGIFPDIHGKNNRIGVEQATEEEVPICREVHFSVQGLAPTENETIEKYLKKNKCIIHPIQEVVFINGKQTLLNVVEINPKNVNSALITDTTKFKFIEGITKIKTTYAKEKIEEVGEKIEGGIEVDLQPTRPIKTFANVAGLEGVKNRIKSLISLYDQELLEKVRDNYGKITAKRSNSLLLYGPPGCGKTLIAEATAKEIEKVVEKYGGTFFYYEIKGSEVLSKYVGEAEKKVKSYFERARELAKNGSVVLFFDEADTLIPDRNAEGAREYHRSLTNQFIGEMNEISNNMFVIGATNLPFNIDPAVARRFRQRVFVPPPDKEVRKRVWEILLEDVKRKKDIDHEELAKESESFTPAEIVDELWAERIGPKLIDIVKENKSTKNDLPFITTEFIIEFIKKFQPTTIKKYISSIGTKIDMMDGYPELKDFVGKHLSKKFIEGLKKLD